MTNYDRWLSDDCCCGGSSSTINPDCNSGCSCEDIYLEINNSKTDIRTLSAEVENKLDASAYTPVSLSGYATEQWVLDKHYISGVDLSNYATLQDIPTVPTNVSAFNNDAGYVTYSTLIQYVTNLQNQLDSIIANVSGCCASSGETLYRWITMTGENDYWCDGTTKKSKEKKQESTDGLIWVDVNPEEVRSGNTVLEENCEDCGYIPSYGTKLIASYNNGNTHIILCSGVWEDGFIYKNDYVNLETGPSGLTDVVIGSCPTVIAGYCFSGCTSLSSVTIPDNVTEIGAWSFLGCTSLTSITLPSGVTSINQSAFGGCRNLENFTCLATTPPALDDEMFNSSTNLIIYVPSASVNAYKSAYNWSAYADRIQGI